MGESGDYLTSFMTLFLDGLVLCGDSEEDLSAVVGRFAEPCKRRGLKVDAGKSKVKVLNGE